MEGSGQNRGATATSFLELVQRRGKVADVLLLALPVVSLVAVFLLPMERRQALAFHAANPTLLTAYTSHFVHYSLSHLLTNLVGYLLLAPLTYVLSVAANRRQQFFVVFGALLLGFPFALSVVNLLVVEPATAIGFSGVVLGFFGYLPISLYQFIGYHAEGRAPARFLPLVFFVGVGSIALVLFWAVFLSVAILIVAVVIVGGYLSQFADREFITGLGRLEQEGFAEIAVAATVLLLAYPIVAFPTTAVMGTRVINLVLHLFGYALSFISTFITVITAKFSDKIRSFGSRVR